ncbi:MAG: TonB family protein [Bryobacterales bacterium]|nr:TonB family protein [Bryobacterales bacterium]
MGELANPDHEELLVLIEDYGRSLGRRLARARLVELPPSKRPLWIQVRDFPERLAWQRSRQPEGLSLPPGPGPGPQFDPARIDPVRRYRESPGTGTWPPDLLTPLALEVQWKKSRFHSWAWQARAAALLLHAVLFGLMLTPTVMELDMSKPADWDAMRITLVTPPLDDLPPLHGESKIPGEGEGGFRGLPRPPVEPAPGPEPLPEPEPEPEPEETAEVPQPVEPEEPEPSEELAALDEPEASEEPEEEAEAPVAKSPVPAQFRRGTELARSRDPRLLPMPRAPSRKRAVLQIENPKASMPSQQGRAQLGTLELTARPDQVIEGAIQQMMRGGGSRQAVGVGVGGIPTSGILPPGPSDSGSLVELLSDPRGVDFRPYLTQVLAAVRRNWLAVIPESARLGMSRGRTLIQFSVSRDGSVPKLVIARSSGTAPLDRAAVAGISASNPFPPLPGEYLGKDIRLQFTFLYNIQNP